MNDKTRIMSTQDIIGKTVMSEDNQKLGEVKALVIDVKAGRVTYAILSLGGFLGINQKQFAIPWQALSPHPEEAALVLAVDVAMLEKAPGVDAEWVQTADRRWEHELYNYYGYRPYWEDAVRRTRPE